MGEVEDIISLNVTFRGSGLVRFQYSVLNDDIICNLKSSDITEPAIINGRPCSPERKYSKASFDAALQKLQGAQ